MDARSQPEAEKTTSEQKAPPSPSDAEKKVEQSPKKGLFDKSLGTAANLSKLLPTGTTLAFQTMAPSFTNRGNCEHDRVNFAFTWGLIGFLTLLCAVLCFTDSVTDKGGNTYYGVATPHGFKLFNHKLEDLPLFDEKEKKKKLDKLRKSKKWRPQDFLHALFSAAVFVALAFCDAGVQNCLVPKESRQWREFLANLPLAVGFLASFVFMIFPSTRNGIGDDGAADTITTKSGDPPQRSTGDGK
ncbi:protein DMP10-like [Phragmites australis]|uniref:protein DMP10-like n=1 Tax=Phragmites australis TaxID=29695 RepID=UPI002D79351F|nr:protein DMP10-like [Phragmites australis]